jgi:hypothetical protein
MKSPKWAGFHGDRRDTLVSGADVPTNTELAGNLSYR